MSKRGFNRRKGGQRSRSTTSKYGADVKEGFALLPQIFISIYALDESPPKHLMEHFRSIKDIFRGSPRTGVFLTGRPQVKAEITGYFIAKLTVLIILEIHDKYTSLHC